MWLRNLWVQQHLGGGTLERMLIGLASRLELWGMGGHKEAATLKLIKRTRWERQSLLTANEAFIIHSLASSMRPLSGDMAEVGVFQGASAKLICEAKGDRTLHLFDTFEGMPPMTGREQLIFNEKQYACSLESVQTYLADYPNVEYHQGRFPESTRALDDLEFSFVHLDVDLYRSTLDCLEYFYPLMLVGGVLVSHDYSIQQGVRDAFREFFEDREEAVVELPTTQCLVFKRPG